MSITRRIHVQGFDAPPWPDFDVCVICGFVGDAGLGYWACHVDEDCTPVCRGKCWREYEARKKALRALADMGDVTA